MLAHIIGFVFIVLAIISFAQGIATGRGIAFGIVLLLIGLGLQAC